jgi:hypothetical protein
MGAGANPAPPCTRGGPGGRPLGPPLLCPDGRSDVGYSRRVARIEVYSFGRVRVDGVEHSRDLIVLPDRVVADWWREDGHSLVPEDLAEVMDELPQRLVVGCGAHGRLEPAPSVVSALAERGIEMEAHPTDEAVRRYTELAAREPGRVAAALHLTC